MGSFWPSELMLDAIHLITIQPKNAFTGIIRYVSHEMPETPA